MNLDGSPLADRLAQIPRYVPPAPSKTYPPFLPCAGLTRRLLASFQATTVPPHATLAYWCTEADNRDDAVRYAGVVTYLLGIRESLVHDIGMFVLTPSKRKTRCRSYSRRVGRGCLAGRLLLAERLRHQISTDSYTAARRWTATVCLLGFCSFYRKGSIPSCII